tara:strand:- start:293 stop:592 length:300 start_codon:yes stop_codon:yes gene_type:complete
LTQNFEEITIDATFKEEVDILTYDLYYGCGTCKTDFSKLQTYNAKDYKRAQVEPFTQTAYRSLMDTNKTIGINCPEEKFVMKMVYKGNEKFKVNIVFAL